MKFPKNMNALFLLSVLAVLLTARAEDYCSNSLCGGARHIACGHNRQFSPRCPANANIVNLSPSDIEQIVNLHNQKRNEIAGGGLRRYRPAARMATMQWDQELASLAVYNVMQCEMKHDRCHNTNTFKQSGQNLYTKWYYGQSFTNEELIEDGINSWYGEHEDANMRFIDEYPTQYRGPAIGHFTELVNANNTHVGCAASRWTEGDAERFLFACNYAVTNILGQPIYKSSPRPAMECVTGRNPAFPNLCSIAEFSQNPNKREYPVREPAMNGAQKSKKYPKGNPRNPSAKMSKYPNATLRRNSQRFPRRRQ